MSPKDLRAPGDWIATLKTILGQGPKAERRGTPRPAQEHRSTKSAVTLLLSNLRVGAGKTKDADTTDVDIRKVVFNAVEQIVDDKTGKSKTNKSKLDALAKFKTVLDQEFAAESKKRGGLDKEWKKKIDETVRALQAEELATTDPAQLAHLDLDAAFGAAKDDVVADAMINVATKRWPLNTGGKVDRKEQMDPAMFSALKSRFTPDVWNDKGPNKRALGPRVCQALWRSGNYDQIAELIDYGVDTSVAARVSGTEGKGAGVYSGFVQPIQHVVSTHLRDVALLDAGDPQLGNNKGAAQGAKKIFQALETKGTAVTVTKWSDVTGSEMIAEFKRNPGTIWGFENIRIPYVQAAHDTPSGAQPLRMMELWEAVEQSLSPAAYARLLDDPEGAADEFIKTGVDIIEAGLKSTAVLEVAKYSDIKKDSKTYIANFRRDAKTFLKEFAAQMPKVTFTNAAVDAAGTPRTQKDANNEDKPIARSEMSGIEPGKFAGGLACKAGLYWAKTESKPVYYCLDGINMDDVTNYKKAKNKAIEDFIAAGGKTAGAKGHDEVITMVELREVLKNWDQLKDTVKFVLKGRILTGDDLRNKVADWQQKMTAANKLAGRTPAPPRTNFTSELKTIDPNLMAKLPNGPVGDMDARDIVKKCGYLVKVAKTRPQIVLKYIMSRCDVLTKYDLIPANLPIVATQVAAAGDDTLPALRSQLLVEIRKCHASFQAPLEAALIPKPVARVVAV